MNTQSDQSDTDLAARGAALKKLAAEFEKQAIDKNIVLIRERLTEAFEDTAYTHKNVEDFIATLGGYKLDNTKPEEDRFSLVTPDNPNHPNAMPLLAADLSKPDSRIREAVQDSLLLSSMGIHLGTEQTKADAILDLLSGNPKRVEVATRALRADNPPSPFSHLPPEPPKFDADFVAQLSLTDAPAARAAPAEAIASDPASTAAVAEKTLVDAGSHIVDGAKSFAKWAYNTTGQVVSSASALTGHIASQAVALTENVAGSAAAFVNQAGQAGLKTLMAVGGIFAASPAMAAEKVPVTAVATAAPTPASVVVTPDYTQMGQERPSTVQPYRGLLKGEHLTASEETALHKIVGHRGNLSEVVQAQNILELHGYDTGRNADGTVDGANGVKTESGAEAALNIHHRTTQKHDLHHANYHQTANHRRRETHPHLDHQPAGG